MTVHFIGAGPGAADLIMVRGRDLIARCPVCLYAGSLVPEEVIGFFDLAGAYYLTGAQMQDLGNEPRAIDRAQIELVAGRISALNQCVY